MLGGIIREEVVGRSIEETGGKETLSRDGDLITSPVTDKLGG